MKPPFLILPLTLALLASAAGPTAASIPEIADPEDQEAQINARSLVVTRKCEVRGVKRAQRTLLLYDELSRATHAVQLGEQVKLRAASKKQFDGRKKLAFADIDEGQRLKLSIRKSDGRILRIDVLPDPEP